MSSKKNVNDSASSSSSRGNRNSGKDEAGNDSNATDDKLFEPSLEMMVNDFDDESTLEQEEKMASTEAQDPNAELNSLQREGEMPIEELLAMYNCVTPPVHTFTPSGSGSKRRSKTSRNAGLDKTLMPPPETPKTIAETSTSNERVKDDVKSEDAATAETDNKPNTNAESAEMAAPETATSTATTSSTVNTTETTIKTEENVDKENISNDTAKSKNECKQNDEDNDNVNSGSNNNDGNVVDNDDDDHDMEANKDTSKEIDTSQTISKTSDIQEESTESNTSDKENNVKDDNKPTNADATDSGQTISTSTKVSIDAETNKNKDGEDDSKPLKTDPIKSEESIKKAPNDDEAMDETQDEDEEESEEEESELKKLYPETYKTNERRLLRANSQPNSDDEEEEDNDYSPEEDEFKKKIMVGSEYQAQIPEGLCRYDDALPYENEDKLVWDPSQLQECDIESYLQKASIPVIVGSPSSNSPASPTSHGVAQKSSLILPNGVHLRDDEGSLFLLLQCGHNTEEALRRRRLNATLPQTAVAAATAPNQTPIENTLWSEEECRNFESGLRVYGKDFHAIQQSKVRTRSVSELVQFYYLWKKTERHDIFANKARLEKKKYNLHPGLTDYMDRFLEEQENNGGISINNTTTGTALGSSHSNGNEHASGDLSPVINSLLYTDCKRQRMSE